LIAVHHITVPMIDTHGQIALPGPYDRKVDPSDWPHADFIQWRDAQFVPTTKRYRARHMYISQRQEGGEPYAGELYPGEEIVADKWYTNGRVHLQDGRGFVLLSDLEPV